MALVRPLACGLGAAVLACQYNVRDVGFVELENEGYTFYGSVGANTPAEMLTALTQAATSAFKDCNIQWEIVKADERPDHAVWNELGGALAGSTPVGMLLSPDGAWLRQVIFEPGQPFPRTCAAALEELVTSPTREEIVRQVAQAFGVILLVEGQNPEERAGARQAIARAIEEVAGQLKTLPKPIAQPPALVVLGPEAVARERVLLWSLGLNAEKAKATHAAVIYGKARWIGPLMRGAEISEGNLARIFSIIGADCECGMDLSWTRGTRLPVRWGEALQKQLANALGFDPESPMVKAEMGRILARSQVRPPGPSASAEVRPAGASEGQHGPVADLLIPTKAPAVRQPALGPVVAQSESVFNRSVAALAVLGVLVLGVGSLILVRARSKNQ
jgi:hypothetical protein